MPRAAMPFGRNAEHNAGAGESILFEDAEHTLSPINEAFDGVGSMNVHKCGGNYPSPRSERPQTPISIALPQGHDAEQDCTPPGILPRCSRATRWAYMVPPSAYKPQPAFNTLCTVQPPSLSGVVTPSQFPPLPFADPRHTLEHRKI